MPFLHGGYSRILITPSTTGNASSEFLKHVPQRSWHCSHVANRMAFDCLSADRTFPQNLAQTRNSGTSNFNVNIFSHRAQPRTARTDAASPRSTITGRAHLSQRVHKTQSSPAREPSHRNFLAGRLGYGTQGWGGAGLERFPARPSAIAQTQST